MELLIKGKSKGVAALVVALQERGRESYEEV